MNILVEMETHRENHQFCCCRICLKKINHEPIKLTRPITDFLEKKLLLMNICRIRNNYDKCCICAKCFNKLNDIHEFFEYCKLIDKFWSRKFNDYGGDDNCTEQVPTTTTKHKEDLQPGAELLEDNFGAHSLFPEDERNEEQCPFAEVEEDEQETQRVTDNVIKINIENCNSMRVNDRTSSFGILEFDLVEDNLFKNLNKGNAGSFSENVSYILVDESTNTEYVKIYKSHIKNQENIVNLGYFSPRTCKASASSVNELEEIISNSAPQEDDESISIVVEENKTGGMKYYDAKKQNECTDSLTNEDCILDKLKPYICHICGRGFRQKNILVTHQTALHFGKKIECPDCGKKFSRRSQLILHNRMHRNEKPFQCDFKNCSAAFRQRQHLIDHKNIHTDTKAFHCRHCNKCFHMRRRLQDHLYKVHSKYRYRCNLCVKDFLKPHMVKNHLLSAHKVEMDDVSHLKININND